MPIMTLVLSAITVCLAGTTAPAATAGSVREPVQIAHSLVLDALPGGAAGDRWRDYLLLESLTEQVARGPLADREMVTRIRDRFAADHPTLRKRPFVFARRALDAWLADLTAPSVAGLLELARRAKPPPRVTPPRVRQQMARLQQAVLRVDRRLATFGSRERAWREYLHWDEMLHALQHNQGADPDVLDRIARRYEAATPLLQESAFLTAAQALREGARLVRAADTTSDQYQHRFAELAKCLTSLRQTPAAVMPRRRLAEHTDWLERRGQVQPLVAGIRAQFGRPNLFVTASRRLLGAGIDTQSSEQTPVRDRILGTTYTGTLLTGGRIDLLLRPSFDTIRTLMTYSANAVSRTRGTNGPATVWTRTRLTMRGSKPLTIRGRGFEWLPSTAHVRVRSRILGVSWDRFLGRQAAVRRAEADRPATERIVARRTERQIQAKLDRWIDQKLGPVNSDYLYRIRVPLAVAGRFPHIHCLSTSSLVWSAVTQADPHRLSTNSDPPAQPQPSDLSLRVHRSFIHSLAGATIAGRKWREAQWQSRWQQWFGSTPPAFKTADPDRLWTVTFAKENPVRMDIRGGTITVEFRADRFTVADKVYPGMWVTARYTLDTSGAIPVANRVGRLSIVPPGFRSGAGRRLGVRQQVFRSMLRKRLDPLLAKQISLSSLPLPAPWRDAGTLTIRRVRADRQWLAIGCRWEATQVSSSPSTD